MNPQPSLPRLVIFDCDGTLVDSSLSNRMFYNSIKAALGLPPMDPEEEAFSFVQTIPRSIRRIIPPELMGKALEAATAVDWDKLAGHTRLQEGVAGFIDFLCRADVFRAVNTNGGGEVRLVLDKTGVGDRFDLIVSADDVERPKPHPEGVLFILNKLQVRPAEAVYIGDSAVDQQTAMAAGVVFWAYEHPELEADFHFDDYRELKDSLGGGNRTVCD